MSDFRIYDYKMKDILRSAMMNIFSYQSSVSFFFFRHPQPKGPEQIKGIVHFLNITVVGTVDPEYN